VNINTAPAEVLYALSDGMLADPGVVDRLIASRETEAFSSVAQNALAAVTGLPEALSPNAEFVRPDSDYFRIEAVGEINDVRRGIVELVKRTGKRLVRVTGHRVVRPRLDIPTPFRFPRHAAVARRPLIECPTTRSPSMSARTRSGPPGGADAANTARARSVCTPARPGW